MSGGLAPVGASAQSSLSWPTAPLPPFADRVEPLWHHARGELAFRTTVGCHVEVARLSLRVAKRAQHLTTFDLDAVSPDGTMRAKSSRFGTVVENMATGERRHRFPYVGFRIVDMHAGKEKLVTEFTSAFEWRDGVLIETRCAHGYEGAELSTVTHDLATGRSSLSGGRAHSKWMVPEKDRVAGKTNTARYDDGTVTLDGDQLVFARQQREIRVGYTKFGALAWTEAGCIDRPPEPEAGCSHGEPCGEQPTVDDDEPRTAINDVSLPSGWRTIGALWLDFWNDVPQGRSADCWRRKVR